MDNQFPTAEFPGSAAAPAEQAATTPWSYEKVLDLHNRVKANVPEWKDSTLPQFAQHLNDLSGSEMFSAGLHDSLIKHASVGIDKALAATGIPEATGNLFGGIGSMISPEAEQSGQTIGKGFLRGAADTALTLGGLGLSAVLPPVGIPMVALGTADTFAKTYTDSGSPAAGVVSAASTLALPAFMRAGASQFAGPFAKFFGTQLGAAANMEAANQASSLVQGNGPLNPFSKEHAFELGLGILPALPFGLHEAMGVSAKEAGARAMTQQLLEKAAGGEAARAAVKTAETGVVNPKDQTVGTPPPATPTVQKTGIRIIAPDDKIAIPLGEFRPKVPEADLQRDFSPEVMAAARARAAAKPGETLFGKPLAEPEVKPAEPKVPLITEEPKAPETPAPAKPVDQAKTLVEVAKVAVEKPISTAGDLEATAKLGNDVGKELGHNDQVSDDVIAKMLGEKVAEKSMTPQAAVASVGQALQNDLNKKAAELNTKVKKGEANFQTEQDKLNAQTPKVQAVIGKAFDVVSKARKSDMDTDVSNAWTRIANKFFEKPENVVLAESKPEMAQAALSRELQKGADLKVLERTRRKEITMESSTGEIENPVISKLADQAKKAYEDTMKAEDEHVRDIGDIGRPVDPKELGTIPAGLEKAKTAGYVERLSAVLREFQAGRILRVGTPKGFKFSFEDAQLPEFGDIKQKTIADFVRDNHKVMQDLLLQRYEQTTGEKADFMTMKKSRSIIGTDPKLSQVPGDKFSLPISTKAFFMNHFLRGGETPAEAARLSSVAMAVSTAYRDIDKVRVAQLVTQEGLAHIGISVSLKEGPAWGVVGFNTLSKIFKQSTLAFTNFLKLHVLGHENFHQMENAYGAGQLPESKSKAYESMLNTATNMSPEEREVMLKQLYSLVIPEKFRKSPDAQSALASLSSYGGSDPREFLATLSGMFTLGAASPDGVADSFQGLMDHVMFSDKQVSDFANMQYLDLANLTQAMHSFMLLAPDVKYASYFDKLSEGFKTLLSTKQEIDNTVNFLRRMEIMNSDWYSAIEERNKLKNVSVSLDNRAALLDTFSDPDIRKSGVDWLQTIGQDGDPGKPFGIEPNWFERIFVTPAQLAEKYPITQPVVDLIYNWKNVVRKFQTLAASPFMTPDKNGNMVLDPKHSGVTRMLNEPHLNDAVSQIFLEQNANGHAMTDEELSAATKRVGLSGADADVVHQMVKNTASAMQLVGQSVLNVKKDQIAIVAARAMMQNMGGAMGADQALKYTKVLVGHVLAAVSGDPAAMQQSQQGLQQLVSMVGNEKAMGAATEVVQGLLPKYMDLVSKIQANPGYTPEVRMGRYYVRYKQGGKEQSFGFDTRKELEAKIAEAQTTADPNTIQAVDKYDKSRDIRGMYGPMAESFASFEQEALAKAKMLSPDDAAVLDRLSYTPGLSTLQEVASQGFGKYLQRRRLVGGREELNMTEGVLDYLGGVPKGLAKSHTRDMAGLYLSDPTMKANPKVRNLMSDYVGVNLDPPAKEWSFLKNAIFQYTMGGNLSSLFVEKMQPLFTLAPHLTQNGASLAGSYKYMGSAMKALMDISRNAPGSEEYAGILKRGTNDGVLDSGVYQQLVDDKDVMVTNLRNLMFEGGKTLTAGQLLAKPIYMYVSLMRDLYSKLAGNNTKIALLSGYKLGRDQGMTEDQAYSFGVRTARVAQAGGGQASRPIQMFAGTGKLYPAVGLWYTLKHYTTSSIAMLYRQSFDSLGRNESLSPTEVGAARKALGQAVATQVLMTGVLGMPFVGGVLSILEQINPNLEVKKALREGLASFAGDDKEMGGLISDAFLHGGIPKVIPGLANVDISSRLGLGDAFGIDPDLGVTAEGMFGAPGSVLSNLLHATQSGFEGRTNLALQQALPASWGHLIKAYNDDFSVRDSKGNLLLQPTDVENVLSAVGFRPKRLSELREEQNLLQRTNDIEERNLRLFHSQLASVLLSGDTATVRQALLQKHREDRFYDPRVGLQQVVQAAQDKVVPLEPRDKGPRAGMIDREDLSSTFASRQTPSELALLRQRLGMERSVGIAGAGVPSQSQLTMAQMVDRLRAANPTLSRAHAQALVSRQLAPNPLYK